MRTFRLGYGTALVLCMAAAACGKKDQGGDAGSGASNPTTGTSNGTANDTADYPMVTPPVEQATPSALKGPATRALARHLTYLPDTLDANAFVSRFFSAGPTELFTILGGVDNFISGIKMQAEMSQQPCLSQNAVSYQMVTPGGNVTMYAQCYESQTSEYSGDPGFLQWALVDGSFYIYSAVGVGWTAAIATPYGALDANAAADANATLDTNGTMDGNTTLDGNVTLDANASESPNATFNSNAYVIHAWYSVGLNNFTVTYQGLDGTGWFNGSYCIAEIYADPQNRRFEMTAAGGGIGFCGAQFASDGNDVFGIGSSDMGSTCADAATVCLDANTGLVQDECSLDQNSFVLTPLGRQAVTLNANSSWGASAYPGNGNNLVVLNGTNSDSAHFGPGAPASGAGVFAPQQTADTNNNASNGNSSVDANVSINANVSVNANVGF